MFNAHTLNQIVGEKGRLTARFEQQRKTPQCPTGVRFAVMGFIVGPDGEQQVIRIDNSPHHGIATTHIHIGESVIYKDLDYAQARMCVEKFLERYDNG